MTARTELLYPLENRVHFTVKCPSSQIHLLTHLSNVHL